MNIAVFSDIHFHPFPAFATVGADGINSRLQHTYNRARDIVRIAQEQDCKAILFAGDLFHTKKIDIETIDVAVRAFSEAKIPIIGVPGNHDMATFGGDARHSARALNSKIRWLDNVEGREVVLTDHVGGKGYKVYGIPYEHDKARLLQELDKVPKGTDIVLMHAGFAGGFMGSDYIADLGDCIDYYACTGKADLVVSGHFHQPQLITWNEQGDTKNERPSASPVQRGQYTPGRSILVPGSPEQHTWGDKGSARGFWIVNPTIKMVQFYPLSSPEFVEVDGSSVTDMPCADNYVRVVGTTSPGVWDKIKTHVPHAVLDHTPATAVHPERAFDVAVGDSPSALIQKYVQHSGTTLNPERLILEGKRLIGCN